MEDIENIEGAVSDNDNTVVAICTTEPVAADTKEQLSRVIAKLLLKIWNVLMLTSTLILSFIGYVLKDDSVYPFIVLGLLGLCLPHLVEITKSFIIDHKLQIEHRKQLRRETIERIKEERRYERQKAEFARIAASNELAEQYALWQGNNEQYVIDEAMKPEADKKVQTILNNIESERENRRAAIPQVDSAA